MMKSKSDVRYPYRTKKRTVLVGGHETFVKVMRRKFPTVKFINADQVTYSPRTIRRADVVWIQNNCISHAQWANIVKVANTHGVPIKYFASAGTIASSDQLVQEDNK